MLLYFLLQIFEFVAIDFLDAKQCVDEAQHLVPESIQIFPVHLLCMIFSIVRPSYWPIYVPSLCTILRLHSLKDHCIYGDIPRKNCMKMIPSECSHLAKSSTQQLSCLIWHIGTALKNYSAQGSCLPALYEGLA